MGRGLVAWVCAALLLAAGAGAARGPASVTLHAGETGFFLPTALRAGDVVACTAGGRELEATVPAPGAGEAVGKDVFAGGGSSLSLDVKPNGAVEARCGVDVGVTRRRAVYPYVVGRNGLGLIRGANTLGRVQKLYGRGVTALTGRTCRVSWRGIGLVAAFAGAGCASGDLLVGATITGGKWSSLSGVRVGDGVARMVWQDQTAKLLSRSGRGSTWVLGGLGRARRSKLLAVVRGGTVRELAIAR